jgi:folate-binding protein YgfZ
MSAPDTSASRPSGRPEFLVPRGGVPPAEREALATRAGGILRGDLARFRLTGTGRIACLQGLVTCDVERPGDDAHCFGALLTAKGMIVSPLWIFRLPDALVVEVPAEAAAEVEALWERSLPPRLCHYEVVTDATASLGVYGPHAAAALAAAGSFEPPGIGRILHLEHAGLKLLAARVAARGLDGFDCIVPVDGAAALAGRLAGRGAAPLSPAILEERRILAGHPRLRAEIDEKTLPQEVRLDELGAVSYTKGCYLGQETVARVHFRGHANRHLTGVALEHAPATLPLDLVDGERTIGRLTSACWWEAGGCYAGLAVLRRDVAPGAPLGLADGTAATAHALPWEPPTTGTTA